MAMPRRPDLLSLADATLARGPGRAAPNTHADCGGPTPRGQAAVPGDVPWPVPILIRSRHRGHSKYGGLTSAEGPVRLGSRPGRVVRRSPLRGGTVGHAAAVRR